MSHPNPVEIVLIAAMAANRVIGCKGTIPWHIPGEQKQFRETTWGYPVIMGRKTHESIGCALPGRRNIIVTRNVDYKADGCEIAHSLPQAYGLCHSASRVFNIGGEQLYSLGIEQADTLLLTVLSKPVAGDAFFPEFSENDFQLAGEQSFPGPEPYSIKTFRRRLLWHSAAENDKILLSDKKHFVRSDNSECPETQRRRLMESKDLKKLLAGLSVAALVSAGGAAVPGAHAAGGSGWVGKKKDAGSVENAVKTESGVTALEELAADEKTEMTEEAASAAEAEKAKEEAKKEVQKKASGSGWSGSK